MDLPLAMDRGGPGRGSWIVGVVSLLRRENERKGERGPTLPGDGGRGDGNVLFDSQVICSQFT